jgi:hypothetical protein
MKLHRCALFASATFTLTLSLTTQTAQAEDCTPPRILFVVDSSSSMLGEIAQTTKWQAAQDAINAVLTTHVNVAEYGLMPFPGAPAQCTTGVVTVDVALGTEQTIVQELAAMSIPGNAQTPAGQTLMAASQYGLITDSNYNNYVIFVTDGHQYCSVDNGTHCVTQADCTAMNVSSCPTCMPAQPDGCYCVQNWPVLGADALFTAGVNTYVVGFGSQTNAHALNLTADAGGTALPNCDPNSNEASCYFQASVPAELNAALAQIVLQVVQESCTGDCGISGERECTPLGWSDCDSPDMVDCMSTCDTPGTQQCLNDQFTECSSQGDCGGAGGTGGMSSGTGGAGGTGLTTSGTGGSGNTQGIGDDPGEEGGCGCRTAVGTSPDGGSPAWLMALGLGLLSRRRRDG